MYNEEEFDRYEVGETVKSICKDLDLSYDDFVNVNTKNELIKAIRSYSYNKEEDSFSYVSFTSGKQSITIGEIEARHNLNRKEILLFKLAKEEEVKDETNF